MTAPRRPPLAALTAALAVLLLGFAAPVLAAPTLTFPALTGRVVDDAHVLKPQTVAELTAKLADLETKTGRQLVVATVPDLQGDDIEDYSNQLFRKWDLGQKGQNNGVLFLVSPGEHKVRIEVGYGLEPTITDALSSAILHEQVLPKFRTGDVEGGIVDGTNTLITQLGADPATAAAQVTRATHASRPHGNPFGAIFGLVIFFLVISSLFRRRGMGAEAWGGFCR